jgi:hypothetical protein
VTLRLDIFVINLYIPLDLLALYGRVVLFFYNEQQDSPMKIDEFYLNMSSVPITMGKPRATSAVRMRLSAAAW